MEEFNRPIFIHPLGEMSSPDYEGEASSKYRLWTKLRWPYATTMAKRMGLNDQEKKNIYQDNAIKLLLLPLGAI